MILEEHPHISAKDASVYVERNSILSWPALL